MFSVNLAADATYAIGKGFIPKRTPPQEESFLLRNISQQHEHPRLIRFTRHQSALALRGHRVVRHH